MKRLLAMTALALPLTLCACIFVVSSKEETIGAGTEVELCASCGEVYGSVECCDEDAAICGDCGKIKGSPGCCK